MKNTTTIKVKINDATLQNLEAHYDTNLQDIADKAFNNLLDTLPLEDQLRASNPYPLTDDQVSNILSRVRIYNNNRASVEFDGHIIIFDKISEAMDFSKLLEVAVNV